MINEKKWNGWGWKNSGFSPETDYPSLLPSLEEIFRKTLVKDNVSVEKNTIRIPASGIKATLQKQFLTIVKKDQYKIDPEERLFHSRGRSLPDTLALRKGKIGDFPDAVIYPENEKQISGILKIASRHGIAIVPFGGGSSVVGGVNSFKEKKQGGIIVINMSRMNALLAIDKISGTARFQCGIFGPDLERKLNAEGYTLGHFPQSFEFSTLGGWIASRGAGYMSDKYGKAEDIVLSLRFCSPEKLMDTEIFQGISEGPLLTQLATGSEGTLGIITEALVKIELMPKASKSRAFIFSNYNDACTVLRECKQQGLPFSMIRISDPEETYYFQKLSSKNTWKDRLQKSILDLLGFKQMTLILVITEGEDASRNIKTIHRIAKSYKGLAVGKKPVRSWFESRYRTPYLRDYLLDFGVGSDTFETWATWSDLPELRNQIYLTAQSLEKLTKKKILLMSHISHSYAQGASIYFTIMYMMDRRDEFKEWTLIKTKFTDTIIKFGGAISHHHGLGMDHKRWLNDISRKNKISILKDLKKNLDPKNIMNPGKIF